MTPAYLAARRKPRMNHVSLSCMLGALLEGPCSARELAEATGLFDGTCRLFLKQLHKDGHVYIASWDKDTLGRHTSACYAVGTEPDMAKPKPKSPKLKRKEKLARARIAALRDAVTITRIPYEQEELEAA